MEKLIEAKNYEERSTIPLSDMYTRATPEYSSLKYVRKVSEFAIPSEIAKALADSSFRCGVAPLLDLFWIGCDQLVLWNFSENVVAKISFAGRVSHFVQFTPIKDVFTNEISTCVLIIAGSQITLYGVKSESSEFVDTGMVTSAPCSIAHARASNGRVFLAGENGCLYELVYTGSFFRSMYLRNPDESLLFYVFPALCKFSSAGQILSLSAENNWVVVLFNSVIRVYCANPKRLKRVREVATGISYAVIQVVDSSDDDVLFYCVTRGGQRDYFSLRGASFSRRSPFSNSTSSAESLNFSSTRRSLLFSGRDCLTLVTLNEDALVNYSSLRPVENMESVLTDPASFTFIHEDNIFVVRGSILALFRIASPEEFLANSRPEDALPFIKRFGEREATIAYFNVLSNGADTSRIDHAFDMTNTVQTTAIYSLLFRLTRKAFNSPPSSSAIGSLESAMKRISRVCSRMNFSDPFIAEVTQAVSFMKICHEFGIDKASLYEIVNVQGVRIEMLDALLGGFSGRIDNILNTLSIRCPDIVSMDEVHLRRGMAFLEKANTRENLSESLASFRNMHNGQKAVIDRYNALRYFTGSVTLCKNLTCDYETHVRIMKSSLRCRGALRVGLEDYREAVLFVLYEALLANTKEPDFMAGECACCGHGKVFTLRDLLELDSPFIEKFFKEKCKNGTDKYEFTLIWKYYAIRGSAKEACDALTYIAEEKPIKLEERIEFLRLANSFAPSRKLAVAIETAHIQKELAEMRYAPILDSRLLSPSDLFNDFVIPGRHVRLALKLVDLFDFCNAQVLRRLWSDALAGSVTECLDVVRSLDVHNSALNLEIVGGILAEKIDGSSPNLVDFLISVGFPRNDVVEFVKRIIRGDWTDHPSRKKLLLDVLRSSEERNSPVVQSVIRYCERTYGVA